MHLNFVFFFFISDIHTNTIKLSTCHFARLCTQTPPHIHANFSSPLEVKAYLENSGCFLMTSFKVARTALIVSSRQNSISNFVAGNWGDNDDRGISYKLSQLKDP